MKKAAATFFAILATAVGLQAAAITVTNQIAGGYFAASGFGNAIPNGEGTVAIGAFSIDDATIMARGNDRDFAGVLEGFNQFANSLTMNNPNAPGVYEGLLNGAISEGDGIAGMQVYTVFTSSSALDGNAADLAVYKHGTDQFLADPSATPDAALRAVPENIILGEATTVSINGNDRAALQALAIPEPSSALLGLVGLVFVAFRRRR